MIRHAMLTATCCWLIALCGATAARAQVFDYGVELATSSSGSESAKVSQVECPLGTEPLGGGGSVFGSFLGKSLLASRPLVESGEAIGWEVIAQEIIPATASWGLQSFAICGNVSGLERLTDSSSPSSSLLKTLELTCPPGKRAISGGFALNGATDSVAVFRSFPVLDEVSNESIGWSVSAYEPFPTEDVWSVDVQVACADLDVVVVRASGSNSNEPSREMTTYCPGRSVALGGGGRMAGVIADWISDASPPTNGTSWTVVFQRDSADVSDATPSGAVVCPEPDGAVLALAALLGTRRVRVHRRGVARLRRCA